MGKVLNLLGSIFRRNGTGGNYTDPINLGIDASNVYYKHKQMGEGGQEEEILVPLSDIVDNYFGYIDNASLIHVGNTAPTNPRVKIWIDTDASSTNTVEGRFSG